MCKTRRIQGHPVAGEVSSSHGSHDWEWLARLVEIFYAVRGIESPWALYEEGSSKREHESET